MSSSKRVSISLPNDIVFNLDYISARLGISRSAFIAQVLTQADLLSVRALLQNLPEQPSGADTRRFRGESRTFVREQLDRLVKLQGGLFDDSQS